MTSSNSNRKMRLSQTQEKEFKQAFDLFDINSDGRITRHELKKILQGLGQNPTEVEIEELIREVDTSGDEKISYKEFLTIVTEKINMNEADEDILAAFKVFDKGGRGKIGTNELREIMLGLGEDLTDEQLRIMIDAIDSNNDGLIEIQDFKTLMAE